MAPLVIFTGLCGIGAVLLIVYGSQHSGSKAAIPIACGVVALVALVVLAGAVYVRTSKK